MAESIRFDVVWPAVCLSIHLFKKFAGLQRLLHSQWAFVRILLFFVLLQQLSTINRVVKAVFRFLHFFF